MDANEKLDWVFRYLSQDSKYGEHVDVIEIRDAWHKEYQENNWATELVKVYDHLESEKYMLRDIVDLKEKEKFTGAWITFAGKVFIESGGYTAKRRREVLSETAQTSAVWMVAIGTGLAGIYGLVELYKNYLPHCVPLYSLVASFLSGAASIALMWTVTGMIRRKMKSPSRASKQNLPS